MTEPRRLADLRPDPRNARRHDERNRALVETALREVGAARSIVVDEDGTILAGNATVQAARALGLERLQVVDTDGDTLVAVRRVGLTPQQKQRLALYDNRTAELAEWDPAQLAAFMAEDDAALAGLFDPDELDALLGDLGPPPAIDPGPQIDRAEELRGAWGTERGQLWLIGRHRLLCGDATDAGDVARLMDGAVPDLVFADPPYGIAIVRGGTIGSGGPTAFGRIGSGKIWPTTPFRPVIGDEDGATARAAWRALTARFPDAVHVWWGANHYGDALPPSSCWLVWDKDNGTNDFADAEIAWTNQSTAVRLFRHTWNGMLRASERQTRVHPTQKPVALCAWVIDAYGGAGERLLDPFAGAGMALVAAEQAGWSGDALEIDPAYVAVCLERLAGMGLTPRLVD